MTEFSKINERDQATDSEMTSVYNVGDLGSIPGLGRSPGKGNGCPLQDSCLANSMDRGAWWAIVHEVAESDTTEWLTHMWTPKKWWKSLRKIRILEPGREKKDVLPSNEQ